MVNSEPYKGIRLMSVTTERLAQLLEVCVAVEVPAARRAIKERRNGPAGSEGLSKALGHLKVMARRKDPYGFGSADTTFHRELCRVSRNKALCAQWESLARQLTIVLGLSVLGKSMNVVVEEHEILLKVFRAGDAAAMKRELEKHILTQVGTVDFAGIIADRRAQRRETANSRLAEMAGS